MSAHQPSPWEVRVLKEEHHGRAPRYCHEVSLPSFPTPSSRTFRGLRLCFPQRLPWFEEAVEDLFRHLPEAFPLVLFPEVDSTPSFLPLLPHRHDLFGLDEEGGAAAFTPRERLLLLYIETLWGDGARSFLREDQEWVEEKPLLAPEKLLALLRGPEPLPSEAKRYGFVVPGGPLLKPVPPPPLQGLSGVDTLLYHLLRPQEQARFDEVAPVVERILFTDNREREALKALPPAPWHQFFDWRVTFTNVSSYLRAIPWHSNLLPEGLPQEFLAGGSTGRDLALLKAYNFLCYSPPTPPATVPPRPKELFESIFLLPQERVQEEEALARGWVGEEAPFYRPLFLLLARKEEAPSALLKACEGAREALPPEVRSHLWRLLVGGYYSSLDRRCLSTLMEIPPLARHLTPEVQRDLLPPLLETWGARAFLSLLLVWKPEEVGFTQEAVASLRAHPEWAGLPASWWWPLLREEVAPSLKPA